MEGAALVRLIETDWEHAVNAACVTRTVIGIVDLSLGVAATGAGLFFLLSDPVAKMDRNDQYTLGSSLVGPGVPMVLNGIRMFLQPSTEETSWNAYRAAKVLTAPSSARSALPSFGVSPLRGGAVTFATFVF